jgi:transposase
MPRPSQFAPEVRERAVRMVHEQTPAHGSQWAAIRSIAEKLGCHPETLRNWLRAHERDTGQRAGPTSADLQRLKELERENRELKRANEILRKASAYFAQAELDRRPS